MKFKKCDDCYEVFNDDDTESLGYVEKSVSRLTGKNVWKIFTSEGKQIKEEMGNFSDQRGYRTRLDAGIALQKYNIEKEVSKKK